MKKTILLLSYLFLQNFYPQTLAQDSTSSIILDKKVKRNIQKKAKRHIKRYVRLLNRIGEKINRSEFEEYSQYILENLVIGRKENVRVYRDFIGMLPSNRRSSESDTMIYINDYLESIHLTYSRVKFFYSNIRADSFDEHGIPVVKLNESGSPEYILMRVRTKFSQGKRKDNKIGKIDKVPLLIRVNLDSTGKKITGIEEIKDTITAPFKKPIIIPYHWSLGIGAGGTSFSGDVSTSLRLPLRGSFQPGGYFGIDLIRDFHKRFSGGVSFTRTFLRGDDALSSNQDRQNRNLNFINPAFEVSLFTNIDLKYDHSFHYRYYSVPYWVLGWSFLFHHPKARAPQESSRFGFVSLREATTENRPNDKRKYKSWTPVFFTGLGWKFKELLRFSRFGPGLDLSIELTLRVPFTEYLDDVSSTHVVVPNLPNTLSRQLADRSAEGRTLQSSSYIGSDGNPYNSLFTPDSQGQVRRAFNRNIDVYWLLGFRLGYVFGR